MAPELASQDRLARICWNSNYWVSPTGEAKLLEDGRDTYVDNHGFGHEEWLFNLSWQVDGWHYGYVQALREPPDTVSEVLNLHLFSIDTSNSRRYIGAIRNCELVDADDARVAYDAYKRNGWLKIMTNQVKALPWGDYRMISKEAAPEDLFDLRYRADDLVLHRPPVVVQGPDFAIPGAWYSQIYKALPWMVQGLPLKGQSTSPANPAPTKTSSVKRGSAGGPVELLHNVLQSELVAILGARYGAGRVTVEQDHVDITLKTDDRLVLFEIKTHPDARLAVREALGQLLEYGMFIPKSLLPELVVVAPAIPTPDTREYIERLRTQFGLPLSYRTFVAGQKIFDY